MNFVSIIGKRNGPILLGQRGFYPDGILIDAELSQPDVDATIYFIYEHIASWPTFVGRPLNIAGSNAPPSGIYQPPSDFQQYLSNGNPQSTAERIYVISNNFGWVITFNTV